MQITDLGKKNNVTVPHPDCQVSPFPSLWSPVHLSSWAFGLTLPRLVLHLLILLGFGFLDFFFFLGSKLYLSFVLLGNKSSSENLFRTKAFKG